MKITRRFTQPGQDALASVDYEKRTSRISNPDGSVVFEMNDAEIPVEWSQLATDIMVSKYFRKAGVPQTDSDGNPLRDTQGNAVTGPEKSVKQVVNRLAGCWRYWGEKFGYFDTTEDAQAFYDELAYMLVHQMCAPNSPQWFNTGLNFAYGITGPAQGHLYCDPKTGELQKSRDAYSHPQPHACFIQSVKDDLVNEGGIMDLWTREARLFKYGSGTGTNFSKIRGEDEPLSGGGKSSGLMSFLKIGDRAAGAIKSGGTTRRAAKMVCLDLDHPDIEDFVNWKVREELKVAALAEGMKHLKPEQQDLAKKLGLKLDYDFNGEGYLTVSGQNSNNSVRIPNRFFKAVEEDGDWTLTWRSNGKVAKTVKARELWDQISFAAWRCADPGVQYDDTINQWHTCPRSGRINASNPCVTGDTRVLTPGGIWRRIDQMIHLPSRLVTNLDQQEIHATDGAFPTGTREVFELRTAGGYRLKLTADHKVWTRQRGWVEAKNLTTTDEVKLPNQPACVSDIGQPQDPRFFQLLGFLVSDANHDQTTLKLDACLGDPQEIDTLSRYVSETWGEGRHEVERRYRDDYVDHAMLDQSAGNAHQQSDDQSHDQSRAQADTLTATLTNRRLMSRLRAFVKTDQGRTRLGDDAFTAALPAQRHLLRGLFTADGVVDNNTLTLSNDSIGLLEDIQLILLGFGIQSSIKEATKGQRDNATKGEMPTSALPPLVPSSLSPSVPSLSPFLQSTEGGAFDRGALPGRQMTEMHPVPSGHAESTRHGLRIEPGSLRNFLTHVGLPAGSKQLELLERLAAHGSRFADLPNYDRVASLTPLGRQQVFDLTEHQTSSFVANGLTVHNCSEYMFLDDTACNLASLNVLRFFDAESRRFDVEGYKHGIRLWTFVLEISVLMASFPSESIARLSYQYRTLGLGYANLGAMLMQAGIAYDSDKGRAICGALSAILTGESYAASAEMARELGAFPAYEQNKTEMLRVIRNHRRAAYDVTHSPASRKAAGPYEQLDIEPVGIDERQFSDADPMTPRALLASARECWDRALMLGERHGYRNAQTTVIAPTGTIGLLMDCDTTGVEPDFALVKFKKLSGGGYFKIANQSLRPALENLGYQSHEIHDIIKYVMGTLTLHDAPHISYERLQGLGFTTAELDKIEASLPATFEISFAFSPWSLGADLMRRLGVSEAESQSPNFNLLKRLGFTRKQIDEANDFICGKGTIEGAPALRDEHLPVFDCANKCGKHGKRYIPAEGHIRMMAAAQPFITGAISKTINLPNDASIDDIKNSYFLSWKLGLKANALYRDGSKLSQPLNVKSDEELDDLEEDDQDALLAAREEVALDVAHAATVASSLADASFPSDNLSPVHHTTVEKIVERIVERPLRRRLPDTRRATTHKFDVAGHEGYITVGLYDDGQPGEVFIRIAKEGSTIGGLMDTIATLVSVSLQYGVPVESLVRKFEHVRFEPSGMTRNPEIPIAKSLVDYIFRWLAMEFVPGYRATNAPRRVKSVADTAEARRPDSAARAEHSRSEPRADTTETASPSPAYSPEENLGLQNDDKLNPPPESQAITRPMKKSGNGHGPRIDLDTAKPFNYGTPNDDQLKDSHGSHLQGPDAPRSASAGSNLRLQIVADPLSQQGSELQADAPACDVCGSITVRSGTCYKCLNCGNSMGCS